MASRRDWLKKSTLALAGFPLLSAADRNTWQARQVQLAQHLDAADGEEFWNLVKSQFQFAEGLHYFNNGSLGPCPRHVVEATNAFRALLDGYPSKYMWGGWQEQKEAVREHTAALFGADPEEIALIHNTTEGMNVIASSMKLKEGDEVILCDHEHTSAYIPWQYHQEEAHGVKIVRPTLPLIPETPEEVVEVFRKAITPRTRVISLVHLTNTNGMILPVKAITEMAHAQGILVALDGAQALGGIEVDLNDLGCDFYANSTHKWLFSPKGMGILYARQDKQELLRALVVSRGYQDKTIRRLENYNTRNLPELLGLGAALDYHELIGPRRKAERLYQLKHHLLGQVNERDHLISKTPADDRLSGGIQTVEVKGKPVREVGKRLQEEWGINVRSMTSHGLNGVRISLSVFNTLADVDRLVGALDAIAKA
ncbi:MAG TPA: aminotransferase [Cytophagales bacterium]|nr:aminotransferase [Cytophagales bacterium]